MAGLVKDDPELDGTDGAHPAWWRGNDAGVEAAAKVVTRALDGEIARANCASAALELAVMRVATLMAALERARAAELYWAGRYKQAAGYEDDER